MKPQCSSVPPRALIQPLTPIGIGSAFVESLMGYLVRLAGRHGLLASVLIFDVLPILLAPRISQDRPVSRRNSFRGNLLNLRARAFRLIEEIRICGGYPNLDQLTFASVEGFVRRQGLSDRTRSWCPLCYHQDTEKYDRLVWAIPGYEACVIHKTLLVSRCYSCNANQHAWVERQTIGVCLECGQDLASARGTESSSSSLWCSQNVVELVDRSIGRPFDEETFELFRRNITSVSDKVGIRELGKASTIAPNTIRSCLKNGPTLKVLLRLAYTLQCKVVDLFSHNFECPRVLKKCDLGTVPRNLRGSQDGNAALLSLLNLIAVSPGTRIALKDVQREAGVGPKNASLQSRIVRNLLEVYNIDAARIRKIHFVWEVCQVLRDTIFSIQAAGETVCASRINRTMSTPSLLLNLDVQRIRAGFLRAIQNGRAKVLESRAPPADVQRFRAHLRKSEVGT